MIRGVILFAAVTLVLSGHTVAQTIVRDQFDGSSLSPIWTETDGNSSAYSVSGGKLTINSTASGTIEGVWKFISFETPFYAPDSFVFASAYTYNRSVYKIFDVYLRNATDSPICTFRIWDSPTKWIMVNKSHSDNSCVLQLNTDYEPHDLLITRSGGLVSAKWDGVLQWQCNSPDTIAKIELRVADYTGGQPMNPLQLDSVYAYSGGPDVTIGTTHYSTIQSAIDAASPNDTVIVGNGIAYEHLTIEKPLTLTSQFGADSTTIDGQNLIQDSSNSAITIIDADSVTISGFTIRGGRGMMKPDSADSRGGGVFLLGTKLRLVNSAVIDNSVGFNDYQQPLPKALGGGAIFAESDSRLVAINCQFLRNQLISDFFATGYARRAGGAILALGDSTLIVSCLFESNVVWSEQSAFGGAVSLYGNCAQVDSCHFEANRAEASSPGWQKLDSACGGALLIVGDNSSIKNTLFFRNTARSIGPLFHAGGALFVVGSSVTLSNIILDSNQLTEGYYGKSLGGGAFLEISNSEASNILGIRNRSERYASKGTVVSAGGAIYWVGSGVLRNSTFALNSCLGWSGPHPLVAFSSALGGAVATDGDIRIEFTSAHKNICSSFADVADARGGAFYSIRGGDIQSCIVSQDSIFAETYLVAPVMEGGGTYIADSGHVANLDAWSNFPDDAYGGNWSPGTNGNISADPQFCLPDTGNFYLKASSPCAAGNHVSGQTVGVFDVGCYGADMVKSLGLADGGSLGKVVDQMPEYGWRAYYHPSYTQAKFEIAVGTDNDWQYSEMWNPAPFNSSDTFVTYAGAPLVDGQTYYLRLRISDGVSWSNWYYTSFHMNTPPTAPVPYAPQWPNITVSTTPDLSVVNATDVENDTLAYDFEVYYDSMLTQLALASPHVAETHNPVSTSWTVTPPLTDNKYYYWRARAFDGYEYSPWSSMRYFIADNTNEPPNPFTLIDPPDSTGSILYNRKPTFRWTYTGDPDPYNQVRYKLELAVDPAFTFKQVIDSLYTSFWIPPDSLPYHSHHWWRVSAIDQHGATTLSPNVKEFWVWTLGDVDHSNNVDIADLSRLIDYLYISFGPIVPRKVGDLDGDCTVDIADLSTMIDYLYISLHEEVLVGGCEP